MNKSEVILGLKSLIREAKYQIESDKLHDEIFEQDLEVLTIALECVEKYYKKSQGVWVATMSSESYDWMAVGQTEDEAVNAIVKEWNKSVNRVKMTREELEDYYCIWREFVKIGECEWM